MDEIKIFGGSAVDSTKVLTVDQFFEYMRSRESSEDVVDVYKAVSWVYRCVQLRCDNIRAVPHGVYRIGAAEDAEPTEVPFDMGDLLWTAEAGLCIWGAAFWVIDGKRGLRDLHYLNPSTVNVLRDSQGLEGFEQRIAGSKYGSGKWEPDQILYFRYYNPTDDLGKGLSPTHVALTAAGVAKQIDAWQLSFFKNGAIPAIILKTQAPLPEEDLTTLRKAWERLTRGTGRAWRAIALRHGVEPQVITPPVRDLGMPSLTEAVRQQVAVAFGVPQTMLEDAANYATAEAHDKQFTIRTIIPECERLKSTINKQLLNRYGLELRFHPDELEVMQQSEAEKGEYVARTGELVTLALQNDLMDEAEARERISYLLETMGLEALKGPPPEKEPMPLALQQAQEEVPDDIAGMRQDMQQEEMRRWERKALRRLKEGKGAAVEFTSGLLDPIVSAAILGQLSVVVDDYEEGKDEIREIFDNALLWRGYP